MIVNSQNSLPYKAKLHILHFCIIFFNFPNHVHSHNNLPSIAKIEYVALLYSLFLREQYHLACEADYVIALFAFHFRQIQG